MSGASALECRQSATKQTLPVIPEMERILAECRHPTDHRFRLLETERPCRSSRSQLPYKKRTKTLVALRGRV